MGLYRARGRAKTILIMRIEEMLIKHKIDFSSNLGIVGNVVILVVVLLLLGHLALALLPLLVGPRLFPLHVLHGVASHLG
jgi:hypothetical protein